MLLFSALESAKPRYKRILAVKLADLGDLLTVTPALQALHSAHPSARIDLLAPPSSATLLRGAPYIDRILTFDKFAFDSKSGLLNLPRLLSTARFLLGLRLSGYDALAIFHHYTTRWGTFKFTALAAASGAHCRAGVDNGRGRFLNLPVPDQGFGAMHEADYWLQVAARLGAQPSLGWRPHIPIDDSSRQKALALLGEVGINHASPLVALHPGAGRYSRARIWPVEGFAAVVDGLRQSHNVQVVVLGGPDELEIAARLVQLTGVERGVANLAGRTTIHETAALIEQCDLFLGNDSGPMHIAAAVRTPVVAVFGPSNSKAWGPYTPPGEENSDIIVLRDLPCMPCFYRGHTLGLREGCGTRPCLTGLRPRQVLDACRAILDRRAPNNSHLTEEITANAT